MAIILLSFLKCIAYNEGWRMSRQQVFTRIVRDRASFWGRLRQTATFILHSKTGDIPRSLRSLIGQFCSFRNPNVQMDRRVSTVRVEKRLVAIEQMLSPLTGFKISRILWGLYQPYAAVWCPNSRSKQFVVEVVAAPFVVERLTQVFANHFFDCVFAFPPTEKVNSAAAF